MGLIDSFWGCDERDNPRSKRSKNTVARASRETPKKGPAMRPAPVVKKTPPADEAPVTTKKVAPADEADEDLTWTPRVSQSSALEKGVMKAAFAPVHASGGRMSALEWAGKNKFPVIAGVATGAAFLAYLAKPAQASTTTVSLPSVTLPDLVTSETSNQSVLGAALGVGLFAAVAAGVALYASEDESYVPARAGGRQNPGEGPGLALGATALGTAAAAWVIFGDHRDAAPPAPPGVWMVLRSDVTAAENAATTDYQRSALNASQVHNGSVGAWDSADAMGVNLQFQRQFKGWTY